MECQDGASERHRESSRHMKATAVLDAYIALQGLQEARFHFISHDVFPNWRVENPTSEKKLSNLASGLVQHDAINHHYYLGREISSEIHRAHSAEGKGYSICSDFQLRGRKYHIPIMNLHTDFPANPNMLLEISEKVSGGAAATILSSGRYFHVYFLRKLAPNDWRKFLSAFLMPVILVSPRYIGHSLHRGYATLRLFPCHPLKPKEPEMIASNWPMTFNTR